MLKIEDRKELETIEGPAFTETWSPHHHSVVLTKTDEALKQLGLEPLSEKLELSADGLDAFGTIAISDGSNSRMELGWRNSMKKTFALGYVGGEYVYVCSNLGFFGKYKQTRIHNASLTVEELTHFILQAISATAVEYTNQMVYLDQLKRISLPADNFKKYTFDLMALGIVPPSKFQTFRNCFTEEVSDQRDYMFEETLAHFQGATTRFLRSYSIGQTMDRSMKLNDFLRQISPMKQLGDHKVEEK